jgi:hypothetical protein
VRFRSFDSAKALSAEIRANQGRTCHILISAGANANGPLDWFCAAAVTRSNLEDWIQRELADGASIQRFKEWEKTKAVKV